MKLRQNVSVIVNNEKELNAVLKALDKEGYIWGAGKELLSWKPHGKISHITVRDNKRVYYGVNRKEAACEKISAKDFLGKNSCIVVYRDGKETVALDKDTGKKAVAKCHPDDEYDFYTGAKLAFERLTADQKEQPKQLYNGKVVCVAAEEVGFTQGKIYEFVYGRVIDDDGEKRPMKRGAIETKEDGWFRYRFIELVE